jgi:hypothetical protein
MSNLSELLPSGGGQNVVEFTASGAVASGKPVILNANGTVTEVAESSVAENVGTASQIASSSSTWGTGLSAAFDVASGTHVIFYRDIGDSSKGKAVVATPSGSSLSFGTPVVVDSTAIVWPDIVYANSVEKVLVSHGAGTNNRGEVYVGTVSGTSISFGSAYAYADSIEQEGSLAWSTDDNVFVVAWDDDNTFGESRVGSVSGTTISYGTEVAFETSGGNGSGVSQIGIGYTTGSKVVVAYRDPASGTGQKDSYARVGTISGTSISWGSRTLIKAGTNGSIWGTFEHKVCYDPISGKVLISYWNESNSDYPEVIVGTISGTTISFGTSVVVSSNATNEPVEMVYNAAAQKIVISYTKNSATPLFSKLVTISGTTPSLSSELSMGTGDDPRGGEGALSYDSTNKNVLVAYPNSNSPYGGKALIYTAEYVATNLTATNFIGLASAAISDTATGNINVKGGINEVASPALATGSETNLTGKTQSPYPVITYDITNSKFVVFFQDGNNSNYGTSVVVTVSGTTVTFGTPVVFNSGSTNYIDATYSESNGKHLVVYPDYGNSQQATAIVGTVSGTSISFGSEQVYDTGTVNTRVSVAYNSNLDKYLAGSTPSSGTINVTVLTVSGTTVSAGTPVSLSGTKYLPNIASNESASDFVLGNNKNDNQSEAHLISVSGTVPTVEASTDLSAVVSSSFPRTGLAFLESNKFVCVYSDNSTNSMYTRTITVSGTSLSLGTASSAFTVDPNPQTNINGAWPLFKATTTSAYLYYQDDTSNYLKYVPISISGTTATSGTEVTYTSQTSDYEGFFYSADAKQGLSFFQSTDSGQQTAAIAQSGVFAIGSDYYVQDDGTLSTTSSSVKVGQAISATTINMMDLT